MQVAVFVFGGNSSVTSSFFTGDVGLMQTIFEIRIFWVRTHHGADPVAVLL